MTDSINEEKVDAARALTPEVLDEIERGLEGVTPGPWAYEPHGDTSDWMPLPASPEPGEPT